MNFLSHFYNEQPCNDPYIAAGIILPDILSNYSYRTRDLAKIHPLKLAVTTEPHLIALSTGIRKHYALDEAFHPSVFFEENTMFISEVLDHYAFECFPRRQYAIAHVMLEILLDRKLLLEDRTICDKLYHLLDEVDLIDLELFVRINSKTAHPETVAAHFARFREHRFIYEYANEERFSELLNSINRRLGNPPMSQQDREHLKPALHDIEKSLFSQKFPIFRTDS